MKGNTQRRKKREQIGMRIYCAGGYCTLELSDDLRRRDIADIYRETGFGLLESLLLAENERTKEKKRIDR